MMRFLILILLAALVTTALSFARPPVGFSRHNGYAMTQVVKVPDQSADFLYELAVDWVAAEFKSISEVIVYADKDHNKIRVKAWTRSPIGFGISLHYTRLKIWFEIVIETRDGRYRYTIRDLRWDGVVADIYTQQFSLSFANSKVYNKDTAKQLRRRAKVDDQFALITHRLRDAMAQQTHTQTVRSW